MTDQASRSRLSPRYSSSSDDDEPFGYAPRKKLKSGRKQIKTIDSRSGLVEVAILKKKIRKVLEKDSPSVADIETIPADLEEIMAEALVEEEALLPEIPAPVDTKDDQPVKAKSTAKNPDPTKVPDDKPAAKKVPVKDATPPRRLAPEWQKGAGLLGQLEMVLVQYRFALSKGSPCWIKVISNNGDVHEITGPAMHIFAARITAAAAEHDARLVIIATPAKTVLLHPLEGMLTVALET